MADYLDSVPLSGIIRIRDMMYSVENPFRLDQGDVSFDSPDTVKRAMEQAIANNQTHYLQTTGVPRSIISSNSPISRGVVSPKGYLPSR